MGHVDSGKRLIADLAPRFDHDDTIKVFVDKANGDDEESFDLDPVDIVDGKGRLIFHNWSKVIKIAIYMRQLFELLRQHHLNGGTIIFLSGFEKVFAKYTMLEWMDRLGQHLNPHSSSIPPFTIGEL